MSQPSQSHFSPPRQRQPAHIGDYSLQELEQLAATSLGGNQQNSSKMDMDGAQLILRQICNEGSMNDLVGCLACAGEQTYLPTIICKSLRFIVLHPRDASVDRTEMLQRLLEKLFDAAGRTESWCNHLEALERKMAAASALATGGNNFNSNYQKAARVSLHAIGPLAHLLAGIIFCLYVDTVRHAHNRPTPMNSQPPEMSLFTAGRTTSSSTAGGVAGMGGGIDNVASMYVRQSANNNSIFADPVSPATQPGRQSSGAGGLSAAALAIAGQNGGIVPPHVVMSNIEHAASRLSAQINDQFHHIFTSGGAGPNAGSGRALLLHHMKREIVAEFTVQPRACENDITKARVAFLTEHHFTPTITGLRTCNFSDQQETRQLAQELHEFLAFVQAKQTPFSLQLHTEETLSMPPPWFRDAGNAVGLLRFYFVNVAEALNRQQLNPLRDYDTVVSFVQLATVFSSAEPAADNMAGLQAGSTTASLGGGLDFSPGFSQSQGTATAPNSQQAMLFDRQGSAMSLSQISTGGGGGGGTSTLLRFGGQDRNALNDFDWHTYSHCGAMIDICAGMFRFLALVLNNSNASNQTQQLGNLCGEMLEACARILCNVTERFPIRVIEILLSFNNSSGEDNEGNESFSSSATITAEQVELLAQFCCGRGAFGGARDGGSEQSLRAFMTFCNVILQHLKGATRSMQQTVNQQLQQQHLHGGGSQNGGPWCEEEDSLNSGDHNNNAPGGVRNAETAAIQQRSDGLREQLQRLTSACLDAVFDFMVDNRVENSDGASVVPLDVESESNLATAGSMLLMRRASDCQFLGTYLIELFNNAAGQFLHELQSGSSSSNQNDDDDFYCNNTDRRSARATLSLVIETAAQAVGSAGALSGGVMTLNELEHDIAQLLQRRDTVHRQSNQAPQNSNNSQFDSQYDVPIPPPSSCSVSSRPASNFNNTLERCFAARLGGGGGGGRASSVPILGRVEQFLYPGGMGFRETPLQQQQLRYGSPVSAAPNSSGMLNDLSSVLNQPSSTNLAPISDISIGSGGGGDGVPRFSFPGLGPSRNPGGGRGHTSMSRKNSDNQPPSPIAQLLFEIFRFSEQLASSAIDALQCMLENLTLGSSSGSQNSSSASSPSMQQPGAGAGGSSGSIGAMSTPLSQQQTSRLIRPEHRGVFHSLFFLFRVAAQSGLHFGGGNDGGDTFAKAALRLSAFVLRSSGDATPPILVRDALGTITRLWSNTVDSLCETAFLPVADDLTNSLIERSIYPVSRPVEKIIVVNLGLQGGGDNGASAIPASLLSTMLQSRQDTFACFFQRANAYCFQGRRVQGAEITRALFKNINRSWSRNTTEQIGGSSNNSDSTSWSNICLQRINAARCWLRDVKAAFMPGRGSPVHSVVFHVALGVLVGQPGCVDCDEVSCADDPDSPSLDGPPVAALTPGIAGILLPHISALQQATCLDVNSYFFARTDTSFSPQEQRQEREQQQQQQHPPQSPPSPHPRPPRAVLESYVSMLSDFMDLIIQFTSIANSMLSRCPASEQLPVYYSVVAQAARVLCEGVTTVHCLCAEDRFDLAGQVAASEHGDASSIGTVDYWSPLRDLSFFGPLCLSVWGFLSSKWFNFGVLAAFDTDFRRDCFVLNRFINSGHGASNLGLDNSSGAGISHAVSAAVANMAVLSFSTSPQELTSLLRTLSGWLSEAELMQVGSVGRGKIGGLEFDDVSTAPIAQVHKNSDFGLRSLITIVGAHRDKLPPRASACYMGWCATIAEWLREGDGGVLARGSSITGGGSVIQQQQQQQQLLFDGPKSAEDGSDHNSSGQTAARIRRSELLRCMQALMCVTENPAQLVNPMFRADWVRCLVDAVLPLLITNQLTMHSEAAVSAVAVMSKLLSVARSELEAAVTSIHAGCALEMHRSRIDFIMRTLTEASSHRQAVQTLVNHLCSATVRSTMVEQRQQQQQPNSAVVLSNRTDSREKSALRRDVLHEPKVLTPF